MTWTTLPPRARAARCGGSVFWVMSACWATSASTPFGEESKTLSWARRPCFSRNPRFTATISRAMSADGATATVTAPPPCARPAAGMAAWSSTAAATAATSRHPPVVAPRMTLLLSLRWSAARRPIVSPEQPARRRLEDVVGGQAQEPQHEDADEGELRPHPLAGAEDEIAETGIRGDQLGRDHRHEAIAHRQPHAREHVAHGGGDRDQEEDLPARGAEGARRAHLVTRHPRHAHHRVQRHDEDRGVGEQRDFGSLAGAQPQHHGRDPRQRRQEAQELQVRLEEEARRTEAAHEDPARHAERAAQGEAREDPREARPQVRLELPFRGETEPDPQRAER